jgi:4-amino-4-deoxy-L-arabinose transferase-like glycosyltransferase
MLVLCALVCAGVGSLYAVFTPPWQNPDEPAHYAYIAQVAEHGCCPVIAPGDWDQAYLSALTGSRFAPDMLARLETVQYEDHQPPLYYLIASVVFRLTDGQLVPLRLLSVVFGVLMACMAVPLGRLLVPGRPFVHAAALLAAGLIPQAAAMHASVNNDALAHLIAAVTLWALAVVVVRGERALPGGAWLLGALAGLAALTKVTIVFLGLLVPLGLLVRWALAERERGGVRALIGLWGRFALPALALAGLWWARNIGVYGFPDVFGLTAHDRVVVGQPLTAAFMAERGFGPHLSAALTTVFNSFWGQLGWMALPLQPGVYTAIAAVCVLALAGVLAGATVARIPADTGDPPLLRRAAWVLMGAAVVAAAAQLAYYNLQFVQFQGRYLFPALLPIVLTLAAGLEVWARILAARAGARAQSAASAAVLAAVLLAPAALLALNAFIVARVLPLLRP